jgi:hypothetical protein
MYSGSGGDSSTDECSSLSVETTLNSPVAAVVSRLKKNDELLVEVVTTSRGKSLVAQDSAGNTAGALTPPSLIQIIKCIEGGYQYVAVVLDDPAGGVVRVRIRGKR